MATVAFVFFINPDCPNLVAKQQASKTTLGALSNIKARGAAWYENELSAKGAVSNIKMARGAVNLKYQNVCLG